MPLIERFKTRAELIKKYGHSIPCPKCQTVGNFRVRNDVVFCLACGRELKKF